MYGHAAAFSLPWIPLTEFTAVADEHQERNPIELRAADDAIDGREKAVVLHQHGRLDAGEVRARRDADAFLLLGEANERHLLVLLRHSNEVDEPCLRQRRNDPHAGVLETLVNQLRIGLRDRHQSWLRLATKKKTRIRPQKARIE